MTWDTRSVTLNVQLPRDVADQAEEAADHSPEDRILHQITEDVAEDVRAWADRRISEPSGGETERERIIEIIEQTLGIEPWRPGVENPPLVGLAADRILSLRGSERLEPVGWTWMTIGGRQFCANKLNAPARAEAVYLHAYGSRPREAIARLRGSERPQGATFSRRRRSRISDLLERVIHEAHWWGFHSRVGPKGRLVPPDRIQRAKAHKKAAAIAAAKIRTALRSSSPEGGQE